MNKLKEIIENINLKNFDKALDQCNDYEKDSNNNSHLISNFRGVIHFLKKDLNLAEINFLKSHKLNSKFEDPIKNLFLIYLNKKSLNKALEFSKKLYAINNKNDLYIYQLAYINELIGDNISALNFYNKCIELEGENKLKALNNIGSLYLKNNKPKISLEYFIKAFHINSSDKIIVNNLLLNYINLRNKKKSEELFLLAEKIDSEYIEFILNKVEYLIFKDDYVDAIKILINHKDKNKFLIILIGLYFKMGMENEAKLLLNDSRDKLKNDRNFYNYLGIRYLYEGDFENGWKYYEYRGSKFTITLKKIKEWNGEQIDNKNIIVFNEQGIGDTIQFSKYLLSLAKISNEVSFVVPKSIQNLFNHNLDKIKIETNDTVINKSYDYKIALGSLIKFFYKDKYKFNDNLLSKDQININKWNKKLETKKPKVGIVWSGSFLGPNEPFRSVPLKSLKKVLSLDINFYSLQNEIWERDQDYFKKTKIYKFGEYNLKEIASIIENLDLVISTDTSILHLSCSLNKETWGIFNIYPDWRWGEFNKINPYPSLKMIKQNKFNQWQEVTDEIFKKLQLKFNLS